MAYDKNALKDFARRWQGKGYEKGETQQFWLQLLRAAECTKNLCGVFKNTPHFLKKVYIFRKK